MNLNVQHLRYLIEVEKYGSITKAASVMFMGQPNLSKAIKEIEREMNITIFRRSARGVVPTAKGEEFLEYAKAILVQLDKMEALYQQVNTNNIRFSIGIPRATYITYAITQFINRLDTSKILDIRVKESNSMDVIKGILEGEYDTGIIRYSTKYENNFIKLLKERKLESKELCSFKKLVLVSKDNPIARAHYVSKHELSKCMEIAHDDDSVPYLDRKFIGNEENETYEDSSRISVIERGSQFDILNFVDNTYMWVSPLPDSVLKRYNLAQVKCKENRTVSKDVFIHPSNYKFTQYDAIFLQELDNVINKTFK